MLASIAESVTPADPQVFSSASEGVNKSNGTDQDGKHHQEGGDGAFLIPNLKLSILSTSGEEDGLDSFNHSSIHPFIRPTD